uniref:Uncharacterized protein n=1 Tax=viral metagenome TaxID=1070528 RepID=A0A6C0DI71_9ZZZZ
MSSLSEPEIADALKEVFIQAEVIMTQIIPEVANRISESEITGNLEEAIETRISDSENPLQILNRIEDDDITQTGMSFIGLYILSLCNLGIIMTVIICYYKKISRGKLYTIFFYLSIIFNILTIIITCVKIVEFKKLELTHQVSYEFCTIFLFYLFNIILTLITLVYSIIKIWNKWVEKGKNELFLILGFILVGVLEVFLIGLFDERYKVLPDEEPGQLRESIS